MPAVGMPVNRRYPGAHCCTYRVSTVRTDDVYLHLVQERRRAKPNHVQLVQHQSSRKARRKKQADTKPAHKSFLALSSDKIATHRWQVAVHVMHDERQFKYNGTNHRNMFSCFRAVMACLLITDHINSTQLTGRNVTCA